MSDALRDALVERWFDTDEEHHEHVPDEQILERIEFLVGEGWHYAGIESERFDEFAWFVGIFEGEGCISSRRKRDRGKLRSASLRLIVTMTDEDVMRRLAAYARCGSVRGPIVRNPDHKPQWIWTAEGEPASLLLSRMLPHLGDRRRAKALERLAETGWHVAANQARLEETA